jgi:hypothetical protein
MKIFCLFVFFGLVTAFNAVGQSFDNLSDQKPFSVQGSINTRALFYSVKGIPARRQPFTYVVSGATDFNFYGFHVPVSFILSEQERSFRQPFNQFGLSPTYKWITLHGGYRNISFSPFTLDGYTMLGAGFELRPGKWHIGFMSGRLNRAVGANQVTGDLQPLSFSRKGIAGKVGYGNDTTNIMISFVKGKDDAKSINYKQDSLALAPAENLAFSVGGRIGFFKHFFIEAEAAASVYTKNTETAATIDTTIFAQQDVFASIMTINGSTELNKAIRAGFGYQHKTFGLSILYRRIDPEYQSMGAYFFQNDLENYTINPTLVLWKSRIRFNGSVGIQRDNLSGKKQQTSQRVISSANASVNFTQRFGIDFAYSNYATTQSPTAIQVNDSLRVAQTTQNFSFTPHYFIVNKAFSHVFTLSLNYMQLHDFSALNDQRNATAATGFFNYQITIVRTGVSVFTGLNYTSLETAQRNSGNRGVTIGGSKSFFNNRAQVRLTNSIIENEQGSASNVLYTHGLSGSYRAGKHHAFNLNLNYINNKGAAQVQEQGGYPAYQELRGEISYGLTF